MTVGPEAEDPLLRASKREALAVAGIALLAMAYTMVYCVNYGYGREAEPIRFVLGFPSWIFWGVVAPWTVCTLVCAGFSWWFMEDVDLGAEGGAEGLADD
ncbi:MAG: DUF997 family protein [Isosphaeraceae bacterium]